MIGRSEAKAADSRSRSESESDRASELRAIDPKPGDLPLGRVKRAEHARGGPNPCLLQKAGMT